MDSYKLTLNNIEQIVERAYECYIDSGAEKREALRTKLTIEEALLKYRDRFGEDTEIQYNESRIFKQVKVSLFISGSLYNPFDIRESPNDIIMDSLISGYNNTAPNWKHKNFVNQLDFTVYIERRLKLAVKLLIAIGVGSVLGMFASMLPNDMGVVIATDYAKPLASAFAGLFCVMAVFLTFFAVSLGIVHAGDLSTVNSIGKRMLGRFFKIMTAIILLSTVILLPFINVTNISISDVSFKSVFDILLQFIPSNPIAPLVEFNTAQILIVGAMFGITMLILGSKTKTLEAVFSECNIVAVTCNSFINSSMIHIYVGINFFVIFAGKLNESYIQSLRIIVIILILYLILFAAYTFAASRKLGVTYRKFVSIISPALMINLSSASYGASFTTSIETLINRGVNVDYASLGHNIGGLLFKPGYAILLTVGTLLSTTSIGMDFELGYIIMIVIIAMALSMSLPTIPGAAVSGFTLMFTQLGLPDEALALVITLNALLDFFTVAINGVCLQSEIFISADRAGQLDKELLNN